MPPQRLHGGELMAKTLARAGIDTQAMAASADVLGVFQGQNVLYLRYQQFRNDFY